MAVVSGKGKHANKHSSKMHESMFCTVYFMPADLLFGHESVQRL